MEDFGNFVDPAKPGCLLLNKNGGEMCCNAFQRQGDVPFLDDVGLFSFSLVHYYTTYYEAKMVVTEANDKVMAL